MHSGLTAWTEKKNKPLLGSIKTAPGAFHFHSESDSCASFQLPSVRCGDCEPSTSFRLHSQSCLDITSLPLLSSSTLTLDITFTLRLFPLLHSDFTHLSSISLTDSVSNKATTITHHLAALTLRRLLVEDSHA